MRNTLNKALDTHDLTEEEAAEIEAQLQHPTVLPNMQIQGLRKIQRKLLDLLRSHEEHVRQEEEKEAPGTRSGMA